MTTIYGARHAYLCGKIFDELWWNDELHVGLSSIGDVRKAGASIRIRWRWHMEKDATQCVIRYESLDLMMHGIDDAKI